MNKIVFRLLWFQGIHCQGSERSIHYNAFHLESKLWLSSAGCSDVVKFSDVKLNNPIKLITSYISRPLTWFVYHSKQEPISSHHVDCIQHSPSFLFLRTRQTFISWLHSINFPWHQIIFTASARLQQSSKVYLSTGFWTYIFLYLNYFGINHKYRVLYLL